MSFCEDSPSIRSGFGLQEERFVLILKGFQYEIMQEFKILKRMLMQSKMCDNNSVCSCKCGTNPKNNIHDSDAIFNKDSSAALIETHLNLVKPDEYPSSNSGSTKDLKGNEKESMPVRKLDKVLNWEESRKTVVSESVRTSFDSSESLKAAVSEKDDLENTENNSKINSGCNKDSFSTNMCDNQNEIAVKIECGDTPVHEFAIPSEQSVECHDLPTMNWLLGHNSEVLSHFEPSENSKSLVDVNYLQDSNASTSNFIADIEENKDIDISNMKIGRSKPRKLAPQHLVKMKLPNIIERNIYNSNSKETVQTCLAHTSVTSKKLLKPKDQACRFCDKKFSSTFQLLSHEKNHQLDKIIACAICGYLFSKEKNLKDHMIRKHSKVKPFVICPICKRTLSNKFCLKRHIRMKHNSMIAI